jgi:hypothetical protein
VRRVLVTLLLLLAAGQSEAPVKRRRKTLRSRVGFTAGILSIFAACVPVTVYPAEVTSINQSCNLVPLMVCGTPPPNPAPAHWYYGYTENAPTVMRLTTPGGSTFGPGNFQLIDLPGGSGANWVQQNLAGGYNGCLVQGDSLTPGDETGPVATGLDTRFGVYMGDLSGMQATYPPDVITTQPSPALMVSTAASGCSWTSPCIMDGSTVVTAGNIDSLGIFDYSSYQAALKAHHYTNAPPKGQFNRRILSVPVGNCSASSDGSSSVPIIGFAHFFLLQEPTHSGNSLWVLGQYIGSSNHALALGNKAVAMPQAKVENCGWLIPKGDELVAQPDASLKPSAPVPLSKPPPEAKAAYCDRDTPMRYPGDNRMIKIGLPLIMRSGGTESVLEYSPSAPPAFFKYHREGNRYLPGPSPTNENHWGSPIPFLGAHRTIILVRVLKLDDPVSPSPRATVLVLKSWKGPFSAGRALHVGPPPEGVVVCMGSKCPPDMYLFRPSGDKELLIMTDSETEPLMLSPESVSSGSESQALIRTVDQAVKQVQELQDPQTDIARGPERQRVMLELKGCMAAAIDKMMRVDSRDCHTVNLAVLLGIKRSELVAYWGPPTWCQRGSPQIEYSPPTGPDCPPAQTPIWTFGHPGNNLYCITGGQTLFQPYVIGQTLLMGQESNLRCMDLFWGDYGPTRFHDRLVSRCVTEYEDAAVSLYVHEEGGAVVGFAPSGREQVTLSERPVIYSDNVPQLTAVSCTADGFDLTTSTGLMHISASDIDTLRIAPRNLSEEYRRANGSPPAPQLHR